MLSRYRSLLLVSFAAACASPEVQVFGRLRTDTLHLFNGDSVELQARFPAVVQGSAPGRMYMYYPFRDDLSDTVRLRRVALGVLMRVWAEVDSQQPPFVVMRAVSLPTAKRKGKYDIANYGFVIEHRVDGHWYFLGEATALR
jgi:hypothetical protein